MKKQQRNIPTILGLFLLLGGLLAGVFFAGLKTSYEADLSASEIPEEVRLTNIDDRSFTVSWVTRNRSVGSVLYGEGLSLEETAGEGKFASFAHHVQVHGLRPSARYFFQIVSGGDTFDDFGKPYVVQTGPTLGASPNFANVVYGTVSLPPSSGFSPGDVALVYLSLGGSQTLSTVADSHGNWAMSVSSVRSDNLLSYFLPPNNALANVFVRVGTNDTASAKIPLLAARPVPNMTLGESYDFSSLLLATSVQAPVATLQIPQLLGASSEAGSVAVSAALPPKKAGGSQPGVGGSLLLLTPYIAGFIIGLGLFVSGFLVGGGLPLSRLRLFRKHRSI